MKANGGDKKVSKKVVAKKKAPAKKAKVLSPPQAEKKSREFYFELMCAAIATTDKGMARLATAFQKEDPHFPSVPTLLRWMGEDTNLAEQYTRARETQADVLADQIIEIADDSSQDEIFVEADESTGASAKRVQNSEFIQRSKLRVDARKWVASKLRPKKYGDKLAVGGDEGNPINHIITTVLSPEDLAL